jgi:serine/threonine protein kinase
VPTRDLFTYIPDFEFKELLGGGGFGAVRRAVDKLGRDVAIKVLTLDVDGEERAASNRQFLKEATTLAKLNHPNIVTLYSFDIDSIGRPYLGHGIHSRNSGKQTHQSGAASSGGKAVHRFANRQSSASCAQRQAFAGNPSRRKTAQHHRQVRWLGKADRFWHRSG